eukprot:7390222-Prymnesium_polylepis.1
MEGFMRAATRLDAGFKRTLDQLVAAGARLEGVAPADLDDEEKAAAVARACRELAVPAELRVLTKVSGAALRSELRFEFALTKSPASQASLLSARFWAAASYRGVVGDGRGGSRFVLAMLGPADAMPDGEACEMAAEAARRGGICRSDDTFTLSVLHDLEKAGSHLEGVLKAAPWSG